MLILQNAGIQAGLPDSIRCLITMIAGLLPIVLGTMLLVKRKLWSGAPLLILAGVMVFLAAFSFAFVGLLLNPRPGRLPWQENLLIALLFALVGSGIAVGGWAVQRKVSERKNDD